MKIFKNIGSKLLIALIGVGLFSCSDFGDLNVDPNNTTVPQTNNLLTQALRSLPGTRNASTGNLYAQYVANSQYTSADNYQTITFSYNGYYNGPLADLQFIININSDPETAPGVTQNGSNANQIAVATILQSYYFLHITDRWGDVPYSEALQAFNADAQILTPVFDRQEAIYAGIDNAVAAAVNSITDANAVVGDIIFDGDMNMWRKFGNTLRMTLALRARKVGTINGKSAETIFQEAISAPGGVVTSNAENIIYQHLPEANNQNAWFASFITREDWTVAATILDYMQDTGYTNPHPPADPNSPPSTGAMDVEADPRIPVYANISENQGEYVGMPYGLTEANAGDINNTEISLLGDAMRQQDSPEFIYHAAQVHFHAAEALRLGWITSFNGMSSVQELYEAGIQASMDQWGVDIGNYLSNSEVAFDAARAEEQIATQKWISMYLMGYESWFEWRATTSAGNVKGYPALDAAANAQNPGGNNGIPVRQGYANEERDLNGENYEAALSAQGFGADDLSGYVWWDRQ